MNKIKQTGFSIVELLIAMVISLVLIFACASVYSSLQSSINVSQGLSNAQESLRGAHYLMSRSVRQGSGLAIVVSGTTPTVVITYGEEASNNTFYGCLGTKQESSATDTFWVNEDSDNNKQLYCTTKYTNIATGGVVTNTEIVALDVQSLSATLAPTPQKGIDITLKIKGMPGKTAGTMGADGFTFSLAMRQRILIDSGEEGKSANGI
ncbi:PilW family protein [Psychromonas hadalis]|uniref:PilW family protein n=1 Tax=Psychromonas hadalis TaxID=211669 RepID=UPI0003B3ECA8|nr:prepilin-type N-terminal cleavage/methylation domain-containing protein [Psychromonas hadalis]